jgi:GTP cyclohydrolase I
MTQVILSWSDLQRAADACAQRIRERFSARDLSSRPLRLYGVPRGGLPAALLVDRYLGLNTAFVASPKEADVFIDDLVDSGATRERYAQKFPSIPFEALFDKEREGLNGWLVFPWEGDTVGSAEDIPVRLLQFIGEDSTREGLKETPARFLNAWVEYTRGYKEDPKEVLKCFQDGAELCSDEIVLVSNLQVFTTCEHHLASVFGIAHVGYIPDKKIIGLSKFQRLVDVYARRLQVQERMTNQIANALVEHVQPLAVGVVIEARHMCMEARGTCIRGAVTVTSALRGAFKEKAEARSEFMSLVRGASRGVQV